MNATGRPRYFTSLDILSKISKPIREGSRRILSPVRRKLSRVFENSTNFRRRADRSVIIKLIACQRVTHRACCHVYFPWMLVFFIRRWKQRPFSKVQLELRGVKGLLSQLRLTAILLWRTWLGTCSWNVSGIRNHDSKVNVLSSSLKVQKIVACRTRTCILYFIIYYIIYYAIVIFTFCNCYYYK